ncbi:hypothetical protein QBC38DRAFT_446839 [Podospora fimiseda]|uniref:Uncharacterized protein n=1 Tax=Podospora fimiseda TaxID=252190 RepID=A0AAN7BIU4_9PEZI|nr:hypothetical protein QBC38DRAFT_446839 [Podospora fimiseda]
MQEDDKVAEMVQRSLESDPNIDEDHLLNAFRVVLHDSAAYRWLISSIELSIQFHVIGRNIKNQIRDEILDKVGTSCLGSLGEVDAIFRVSWAYNPHFYWFQEFLCTNGGTVKLLKNLTATGDSMEYQVLATTSFEYMTLVWPHTGGALLKFLEDLFQDANKMSRRTQSYHSTNAQRIEDRNSFSA